MANFDFEIFSVINSLTGHHPFIDFAMLNMAKYGELLYAGFLLYLWFKPGNKLENRKLVFRAVISALIALGINQVIGLFYFRPRPFAEHQVNMLIDKSPDPSFPSDHATGSNALTWAIFGSNRPMGWVMAITSLLLMVSRVYVGTHYPLDVIGGAITGILGTVVAKLLWQRFDKVVSLVIRVYDRFMPV